MDKCLTAKSETQFKKFCEKLPENQKQSTYHHLLDELVKSVLVGDFKKFEKICRFIVHFTETCDKNNIKQWVLQENHPLHSTNLVILCCKFNRNEFLEFLLIKNNGSCLKNLSTDIDQDTPSAADKDEEQHNAFYYAMRNGNVHLLELLLQYWSDNCPNISASADNEEISRILSETYEELIVKNVDVTEKVMDFVTRKLFDIRFKFAEIEKTSSNRNNKSSDDNKAELKLRIDLVLDNIDVILNEYSDEKEFDLKLLFLCRSLAKDICILKKRLRSTYTILPWEEIEFMIVAFVLSQTTRQKINLIYLMTFRENRFFQHLKYFGEKLKSKSSHFVNYNYKPSGSLWINRHSVVSKLKETDEQYRELVNDFETIKDAYSFQKILEAIDSALDVDPSDQNAPLVGIRVLQTIGECLKNTLESPNLSSDSIEKFLVAISKNFRDILMTLRNSFSHARGLIKRFEMLQRMQGAGSAFITDIQNDLKDIRKIIVQIVHKKEFSLVCEILVDVFKSVESSAEQITRIVDMIHRINFDVSDIVVAEETSLKEFNVRKIVQDFEKLADNRQFFKLRHQNKPLLDEIKGLISKAEDELRSQQRQYIEVQSSLQQLQILWPYNNEINTKILKKKIQTTLMTAQISPKNESLNRIAALMFEFVHRNQGQSALGSSFGFTQTNLNILNSEEKIRKKMAELVCKMMSFLGLTLNELRSIQDLKYDLCLNDLEYVQQSDVDVEEHSVKLFSENFNQLYRILCEFPAEAEIEMDCKRRNHLNKALEITLLDIMSIMKWSNDKFIFISNFTYLDSACPILLSGAQLRNYLAHGDPLFDILPINTAAQIRFNAEKFLKKYKNEQFNISKRFTIGCSFPVDSSSSIRKRYDHNQTIIEKQERCFQTLGAGDLESLLSFLKSGADIKAKDLKCRTTLHYAAANKDPNVVRYLVMNGLDPNCKDLNENAAFHLSIKCGNTSIAEYFLTECNIDKEASSDICYGPMHLAAESGSLEMVNLLLKHNLNVNRDKWIVDPVTSAILYRQSEITLTLLKCEKDPKSHGKTYLQLAAEYGLIEVVKYLLEMDVSINSVNEMGISALHSAVVGGNYQIVELLLFHGIDPNGKSLIGTTPLICACEEGSADIIKSLLEYGADPTAVEHVHGRTALHMIGIFGCVKGAEYLLAHKKVNALATTSDLTQPIHFAAGYGHVEIIKMLIDHGADVNAETMEKVSPLQLAAFYGHLNVVQFLLQNGAKVNSVSRKSQHWWQLSLDSLRCAAINGHIDIVKFLISNGAKTNSNISTHALELAAQNGHNRIVSIFLEKGGNVTSNLFEAAVNKYSTFEILVNKMGINKVDSNGFSLLHCAAQNGKTKIVKRLIELGANINLETKDSLPDSALSLAIANNHIAVVKHLLKCGALIRKNENSIEPLLLSSPQGSTTIFELLLKNDVFDEQDKKRCLQVSVWFGFVDMVDILLKHVNLPNQPEFATELLRTSIINERVMVAKLILSKGVNVNIIPDTFPYLSLLHMASMKGCAELVKCLIEHGARVDAKALDRMQPLHYAISHRNLKCVQVLIENGADVTARELMQRQPIEFAVANNDVDIVACLLATKRCDVNKKTTESLTLLHIAAQRGHLEMTKFLCGHKANINARNDHNSKPIHHAARDGHIRIVEFYLNTGSSVNECGYFNKTLLHYAATFDPEIDNSKMIAYLYSQGADLNAVCSEGRTPLDVALLEKNQCVLKALLNLGATYTLPENVYASLTDNEPILAQLGSMKKLFNAVKVNDFREIERLVKYCNGQVNAKNDKNVTVLHIASWKGYLDSVQMILKCGANPNILGKDNSTPIHYAAKFNHFKIVKALLSHGAIYNKKSTHGKTALQLTENNNIKKLLEIIDKSFSWIRGGNIRMVTELSKIKDFEMLKAIVRAKNENFETIMLATVRNSLDFTVHLQQLGQDVDALEYNQKTQSLFANERFGELLAFLTEIRQKRSILFGEDCPGNLAIDCCISMTVYKQGKYDSALQLCNELLGKRMELLGENAKDTLESGSDKALILHRLGRNFDALEVLTPVIQKLEKYFGNTGSKYFDCQNTFGQIQQELQNYEAALKAYTISFEGWKKLCGHNNSKTLVSQNNIALVLGLLERYDEALKTFEDVYARRKKILGANHSATLRTMHNISDIHLHIKSSDETLQLLRNVWESQKKSLGINHVDTLRTQLKIGNALAKDAQNYPALKHFNEALPKLIEILGTNHPDILVCQRALCNIQMELKANGQENLNQYLVNVNAELFEAVISGNLAEVESLVNSGADVNGKDSNGFTPLHFAVRNNSETIVTFLLEKSADPTQTSNKGNSALHTAASMDHADDLARILLTFIKKHSISNTYDFINGQTKNGKMTPLHVAVKSGFVHMAKVLLTNGAIFDLPEANGLRPIDLSSNAEISKWLKCCDELFQQAQNKDVNVMDKLRMMKLSGCEEMFSIVTSVRNCNNKTLINIMSDHFARECLKNYDFMKNFI